MSTSNRTVCADQIADSPVMALYAWAPLRQFLADVLDVPVLDLLDDDPRYDDVAALIDGRYPLIEQRRTAPGTLSVFAGRHTAHRVTATSGSRDRVVAVFSCAERSGVRFTDSERHGFYGRA